MKNVKIIPKSINIKVLALFIYLLTLTFYFFTSPGSTPYDYFTRLAHAFLQGKYYLTDNPSWLSELIPLGAHRFAVVYPPGPALLIMPFLTLFGPNFSQTVFSILLGSFFPVVILLLTFHLTQSKKKALFLSLLAAFGNIYWYMTTVGSVWYLGQTMAVLLLSLSLLELETKKRGFLIGLLLGLTFLSRIELIFAFPFFFLLLPKVEKIKLTSSFTFFVILYLSYNYIRFGNFLQTGYSLIPGVLAEPWYQKGILHYSYIINNLRTMFISLPLFKNTFPYITPSWGGLSIAITTPAFLYSLVNNFKRKEIIFAWVSLLIILLTITMHGETGFTQFGYRFALDIYPLLFFLLAKHFEKRNLVWHHYLLLAFSILVNLWGVLWINKFGWVSF